MHVALPPDVAREAIASGWAEVHPVSLAGMAPENIVMIYLQSQGYRILPVNPRGGELFGEQVFRTLSEIDVPVVVVEVFRPAKVAQRSPERPSRSGRRCSGSKWGSYQRKLGR